MVHSVRVDGSTSPEVRIGAQLRELYDEHYRSLVKLASFYLDDVESCEEAVQDAFVNLLARQRTVESGKEASYLRSAVLNGARSGLRKRRVRREKQPDPRGPTASPEGPALQAVVRDEVLDAIRSLPKKQADIVVLRYYLDLSEAQIAETLGMAKGTVKSHSHRALKKLSTLLEDLR